MKGTDRQPIVNYMETSIYTAPKRDYENARAFIRAYWAKYAWGGQPSASAKYLKEGWERWCVGSHTWWDAPPNALWHLSYQRIPRARPVWVIDLRSEFFDGGGWNGRCD